MPRNARERPARAALRRGRSRRRRTRARTGVREQYDVFVLDVLLPRKTGLDVCRELRELGTTAPILMLTARDSVPDRVSGLDAGADDYLPKPFHFDELLARIRALLRRRPALAPATIAIADLKSTHARSGCRARAGRSSSPRANTPCSNISGGEPTRWSRARRSWSTSGTTTTTPSRTSSRSTYNAFAGRSTTTTRSS